LAERRWMIVGSSIHYRPSWFWEEEWEDLPDKEFFVGSKEAWGEGDEVLVQLMKMWEIF
jgi:hypothetical protein